MIVKSVERNALNMYEARKCLLGLESSGVTIATSPSPASCPAGLACPSLDILASAGLGLTGLGITFIIIALLSHWGIDYPVPFLSLVWGYILKAMIFPLQALKSDEKQQNSDQSILGFFVCLLDSMDSCFPDSYSFSIKKSRSDFYFQWLCLFC